MKEITPKRLATIEVESGEIYKLNYTRSHYICLCNHTDGDILISDEASVPAEHSVVVSAGNAYNDLFVAGYVYVKAIKAGKICVVMKG